MILFATNDKKGSRRTMTTLPQTRTACFGQEETCLRCQSTGQKDTETNTYLLLGPQNDNARKALVKTLQASGLPYQDYDAVLAISAPQVRLSDFGLNLSEATASDVRAVFFAGDLNKPTSLLRAFVQAEPLPLLLAQAQDEWVRDALDGWLFSVFHPIIRAGTGEVFGHEALLRAHRPETGETHRRRANH